MTRPMQDHVRRRQLPCKRNKAHGTTTHAEYGTGVGYTMWQCMECNKEKSAQRYALMGNERRKGPKLEPQQPKVEYCAVHFVILPVTGICSECEG
jgi:hypothetical protein